MDIILEFESKIKNIGGEKVYSAREIMKIFGYDKWERFLGAINRAKIEIEDTKKRDENFMMVVNKETGGRPKEDVLLTLGACYLVLKKCDERKANVRILLEYLSQILEERKNKKSVRIFFGWEKVFLFLVLAFLFGSFVYYAQTYLEFFNKEKSSEYSFDIGDPQELAGEKKRQEEVFHQYDQQVAEGQTQTGEVMISAKTDDFGSQLDSYIKNGGEPLKNTQQGWNQRSEFLKKVSGEDLLKAYFYLGNAGLYRDSCSLLSPKNCISSTKGSLANFGNFWEKTKEGYEILEVRKAKAGEEKNIYCIMYKYQLKYDTSNNPITETFNYTTQVKNGYEQITGRFCESMEKAGKKLKCPFQLQTYYCK